MLRARRDRLGGEACKAIPSIGEVEGRIIVLEFLALAALTRLLQERDDAGQAEIVKAIRRTVERKCHDAKLCDSDACCAVDYADELVLSAQEQVAPVRKRLRHA